MDRKNFFKKLGIGLAVAAIAPKILNAQAKPNTDGGRIDSISFDNDFHVGGIIPSLKRKGGIKREYIRASTIGGLYYGTPIEIRTKYASLFYGDYVVIDSEHAEVMKGISDIATDEFVFMIINKWWLDESGFFYTALPIHQYVRMKGEYSDIAIDITFKA